jgi:MoxR-like ATPase
MEWAIKEATPKLDRAGAALSKMREDAIATGRSTATLDRVIARRRAVHARLLIEALGLDASMVNSRI